jgi:hypothetical protein
MHDEQKRRTTVIQAKPDEGDIEEMSDFEIESEKGTQIKPHHAT